MKITCCHCQKNYPLEDNIFSTDAANRPVLVCPHCRFKHLIDFLPLEHDSELKNLKELTLTTTYYADLTACRIANSSRADQSGSDDGNVTNWTRTADFILATQIGTSKGVPSRRYMLNWRDVTDEGSFAPVASTGEINYTATTVLGDGTTLGSGNKLCTGTPQPSWQDGMESEGDNELPDAAGLYSLADDYYTEFQWALSSSSADYEHIYEFELYEITNGTSIGTCGSTLTTAAAVYKIEGVTKDNDGVALGSCKCFLLYDNLDQTFNFLEYQLSNASTGAYSFTGLTLYLYRYSVVSWKDDTPHVMDVTSRYLRPVVDE